MELIHLRYEHGITWCWFFDLGKTPASSADASCCRLGSTSERLWRRQGRLTNRFFTQSVFWTLRGGGFAGGRFKISLKIIKCPHRPGFSTRFSPWSQIQDRIQNQIRCHPLFSAGFQGNGELTPKMSPIPHIYIHETNFSCKNIL